LPLLAKSAYTEFLLVPAATRMRVVPCCGAGGPAAVRRDALLFSSNNNMTNFAETIQYTERCARPRRNTAGAVLAMQALHADLSRRDVSRGCFLCAARAAMSLVVLRHMDGWRGHLERYTGVRLGLLLLPQEV